MEDITKCNDFHANNKNRPRVNAKALERVNVERIEEICDAVLDFMVVKYLFEKYPDEEPGQ
ncbi:12605_t:CDS:2 [Cetraspora pellucida]|uniref:12605_t:CDS:1 n=1 Tax=Cetraspora pellucida TaxID=1433469 RepID=A0ACA9L912_9GLOM|nr:12605_t:CDS:2 [Cetraspora pellucida]